MYFILLEFTTYTSAYTVTYLVGMISSFLLNAQFVFKVSINLSNIVSFPLIHFLNFIISIAFIRFLIERAGVSEYLAPLFAVLIVMPLSYLLFKVIFKK